MLVVDDNQSIRSAVSLLIEADENFHVVGEAADGLEAIEKTRELKPDLILLDLAMPKLNGAATASVLRNLMPKVVIVMFTMYDDATDKLGQAVGADLVVAKPDGIHVLVQRLNEVLNARSGGNIHRPVGHTHNVSSAASGSNTAPNQSA